MYCYCVDLGGVMAPRYPPILDTLRRIGSGLVRSSRRRSSAGDCASDCESFICFSSLSSPKCDFEQRHCRNADGSATRYSVAIKQGTTPIMRLD